MPKPLRARPPTFDPQRPSAPGHSCAPLLKQRKSTTCLVRTHSLSHYEQLLHKQQQQHQQLHHAYQLKSKLLRRLAHELKTPLHAVYGFAQLLEKDLAPFHPSDPSASEPSAPNIAPDHPISLILQSCLLMQQMLDKMLDFELLESGHLQLHPQYLEPLALLEQLKSFFTPLLSTHQHTLYIHCAPSPDATPIAAYADPLKTKQILINLISNAIKYSQPASRIDLFLELKDSCVLIHVQNLGIPKQTSHLSAIFSDFGRLKEHQHIAGNGLGLPLSFAFARLQQGSLTHHFDAASNTTNFTLTLPAASLRPETENSMGPDTPHSIAQHNSTNSVVTRSIFAICRNPIELQYVSTLMSLFDAPPFIPLPDLEYARDILTASAPGAVLLTPIGTDALSDAFFQTTPDYHTVCFDPLEPLDLEHLRQNTAYYRTLFTSSDAPIALAHLVQSSALDPIALLARHLLFLGPLDQPTDSMP